MGHMGSPLPPIGLLPPLVMETADSPLHPVLEICIRWNRGTCIPPYHYTHRCMTYHDPWHASWDCPRSRPPAPYPTKWPTSHLSMKYLFVLGLPAVDPMLLLSYDIAVLSIIFTFPLFGHVMASIFTLLSYPIMLIGKCTLINHHTTSTRGAHS